MTPRIVLVTRRTRLEDLVARFNTVEQARFYIEHLGEDFGDYQREHATYQRALRAADAALSAHGRVQRLDRGFLPNFLFAPDAIVAVLGQDGLVANTLKYLDGQPVLGVNPDPVRWDGVLLPFQTGDLSRVMPDVLAGRRPRRRITFARATLSDGQQLLAVNDLFVGPRSHTAARYRLEWRGESEAQCSSGVIVSTGLGSTGWLRSLLTFANAFARKEAREAAELRANGYPWDAGHLYFTVREPFPSKTSQTALIFGRVGADAPLRIVSQMAGSGVIFSDGIESDYLEFNAGMAASIDVAEKSGCLVV